MAKAHVYQIFDSETERSSIDPAFTPLANATEGASEWLEFGAIRSFLHKTTLEPDGLYAFVTGRFLPETAIPPRDMLEFIGLVGDAYDVVNFTPFPDQHTLFWNLFEQGEYQIPGHAMLAQDVIKAMGLDADVTEIVMDSRNSILRTYFAAKPRFWARWLDLADKLVALADAPTGKLRDRLNMTLPRRSDMPGLMIGQQKVVMIERLASLILAIEPSFKAISYHPFQRPRTRSPFAAFPQEAVLSDALKIAFNVRGDPVYKMAFAQVREEVQKAMQAKQSG